MLWRQEERAHREHEAETHLRSQLEEAEEAMQTCVAAAKQASQRAEAERKRLQLAAGLAQDTEKALRQVSARCIFVFENMIRNLSAVVLTAETRAEGRGGGGCACSSRGQGTLNAELLCAASLRLISKKNTFAGTQG